MIENDGDIIRGLGFVVMHAAHLEGKIDDLLLNLSVLEPYSPEEQKWPISKKIKKARSIISEIDSSFALQLMKELDACKEHFEWRNELVHGRIYSPEYHKENLVSQRQNVPSREANSGELYTLANNLVDLKNCLNWPITLPNLIFQELQKRTKA
jgi:hypothetical protein